MSAEPAERKKRTVWLRAAGWAALAVLLMTSAALSYAIVVFLGR